MIPAWHADYKQHIFISYLYVDTKDVTKWKKYLRESYASINLLFVG